MTLSHGRIPCQQCPYLAQCKNQLSKHMVKKHNAGYFHCDACDYKAYSSTCLRKHKQTNHNVILKTEEASIVTGTGGRGTPSSTTICCRR